MLPNTDKSFAEQIPLNLEYEPSYLAEDFIVADENLEAVTLLDQWPNWHSPVIVLYGVSGCGKTHLLKKFFLENQENSVFLTGKELLNPEYIVSLKSCIIIDDAEKCPDENLFHLFNMVKEENKTMLLSAKNPPARWQTALPDLTSRLASVINVGIKAPSDELIAMVIVKMFSDKQIDISKESLNYLVKNMERSFLAASKIVETADKLALAKKKAITIPLLKDVLANF